MYLCPITASLYKKRILVERCSKLRRQWLRERQKAMGLNLKKNKKNKFIVLKPCQKRTNQPIQLLINSQKIDQVKETVSWE